MIGFVRGLLTSKQPPLLVVDVNGIGYEIEAPMSTFYVLPAVGAEITLVTHLLVREDAQILFGFSTESERRLFRDLIRISGVGAKMALAILSGISVEGFVQCVQNEDTASLVKVPGVGKKTAERLIVEMRDRIEKGAVAVPAGIPAGPETGSTPATEAQNALVALGYRPAEALRLLASIDTKELETEEIIRRALQNIAPR
jgi:Holliday junction DNA helicase RuvA